jgi:hypothetical protein
MVKQLKCHNDCSKVTVQENNVTYFTEIPLRYNHLSYTLNDKININKNLTVLLQNLCRQEISIKVNRIHKPARTHLENIYTPVWTKFPTFF